MAHARARADAGIHDARAAQRGRRGASSRRDGKTFDARCPAVLSRQAALVLGEGPERSTGDQDSLCSRRCRAADRDVLLAEVEATGRRGTQPLAAAARGRVGGRAAARAAAAAGAGARPPRPTSRLADRCLRAAELRPRACCSAAWPSACDRDARRRDPSSSRPTARTRRSAPDGDAGRWLSAEQSNSSLIVGDAVMLKIFRRHRRRALIRKPR